MNGRQTRLVRAGRCMECGRRPLFTTHRCLAHALRDRLAKRQAAGCAPWRAGSPGRPPIKARKKKATA